MIRNLKTIGLSLVALLAMSALFAAGASAQFEAKAGNTTLTASSNNMPKFAPTSGGIAIECTTITFDNSTQATTPATEVPVQPTYSNCETFLGAAISITTNGCKYVFKLAKGSTSGTTDIECPAGKSIELKVGSICAYSTGSQTALGTVKLSSNGLGRQGTSPSNRI